MRVLEPRALLLHLRAEDLHLLEDVGALIRDAVDRVDPRDQVVHRGSAEQYLEPCVLVTGRVHRNEMRVQLPLRVLEIRLRELELGLVRTEVALDPGELVVGEVVRLDGQLEVRVETLDLSHDAAGLGLFRRDRPRRSKRRRGSHEGCREADEEHQRLPHKKAEGRVCPGHDGRTGRGPVRHEHGTLTTLSDDRKPLTTCRLRRGRPRRARAERCYVPRRGRAR